MFCRYVDTCFEEANACLKNSLVPMRLVHHGTYPYHGEEFRNAGKMLDMFGPMKKFDVPGTIYQKVVLNQTIRD